MDLVAVNNFKAHPPQRREWANQEWEFLLLFDSGERQNSHCMC